MFSYRVQQGYSSKVISAIAVNFLQDNLKMNGKRLKLVS